MLFKGRYFSAWLESTGKPGIIHSHLPGWNNVLCFFRRMIVHPGSCKKLTNLCNQLAQMKSGLYFQGFAFRSGNNDCGAGIAPYINRGTRHIEDAVNGQNQTDSFEWQVNGV